MRIRKGEISAFLKAALFPGEPTFLLRGRHPKFLLQFRSKQFGGWILNLRCSHGRRKTIEWLVSKAVLGFQLSNLEGLLFLLLLRHWSEKYLFFLLSKNELKIPDQHPELGIKLGALKIRARALRIYRGYRPSVLYSTIWRPLKFRVTRRNMNFLEGKGNEGPDPSWRDRVPSEEENSPSPKSLSHLVFVFWSSQLLGPSSTEEFLGKGRKDENLSNALWSDFDFHRQRSHRRRKDEPAPVLEDHFRQRPTSGNKISNSRISRKSE